MTDERGSGRRGEIQSVYDEIAGHFSETRAYPWPEVEEFLASATGDLGLDLGCGNGRHTALLTEVTKTAVGVDVSRGLLGEAQTKMHDDDWTGALVQGDAAAIPLASGSVDVAVYVATLHHLPDRESRLESLRELDRVLAPDGRALVSTWSTAHDRFEAPADAETGFETTVDWTLPDGETVPRFYYIYAPTEFERDLDESGLAVTDSYVSSGNCYAELR
ncbi:Methyltransferase domain-containing protein [Halovenus aranensis]|jgi:ubiquinone/menaquinone biosynthesis C-methylase UbiE|uniref:Methyltransferase domain-containing protein n=1 Tax=Halovenus aranensis TaxID=890420 RepID=A0A1G8RWF3_9EURY|nr:class I SAM-dependent methyltransferase [Halovenus aranensis]SDJ21266.1 Methyltransferase domain-containing protein [Halovenus aranensis]